LPLTQDQAIKLLVKSAAPGRNTGTGEKYGAIDPETGKSVVIYGRIPREGIGQFHGNVAGTTRSRKGHVRRKLDGSRKYIAGRVIEESVLWYKV
jgi:hypothetical protein